MVLNRLRLPSRRSSLGQALVETAIILPLLLILLLGAIDFGRAFFGWVNLHQAVRIGANFAATHATMTASDRDRFVELVEADIAGLNCEAESPLPNATYSTSDGTPTMTPSLGDYATLTLQCEFSPVTPLIGGLLGDPISMSATSTFPVREGCINCPTPVPATPPPAPIQCFPVPNMNGMSVAGARLAWASAGFDPSKFTPSSGQDTQTVNGAAVTENDSLSTCSMPTYAIFSSSVIVTVLPDDSPCPAGSAVVPNMIGMSVATARTEWNAAGFDPASFTVDGGADPDGIDSSRRVVSQLTVPATDAGVECGELTATVDVVTGLAWPAAPPTPCRVPNMIQLTRAEGQADWVTARFAAGNFDPSTGNFTIRRQSLVGGTYVGCDASVTVGANP